MKGEQLYIAIENARALDTGIVIISGTVKSGQLSLNQKVYLHDTVTSKPVKCTIIGIVVNKSFRLHAQKLDKLTSYILGAKLEDFVFGKTYIGRLATPVSQQSVDKFKINKDLQKDKITNNNLINSQSNKNSMQSFPIEKNKKPSKSSTYNSKLPKVKEIVSGEKELIECIQECLRYELAISSTEKYVLIKIAESFGIKSSRCEELIQFCISDFNYNKNITTYRNAILTCLLDSNYLSKTEFILLEKLRCVLNISEDVAYDIIYDCNWSYSDIFKREKDE